jgi:hypothetical protein
VHFQVELRFGADVPGVAGFEVISSTTHLVTFAGSVVQSLLDMWLRNGGPVE